MKRSRNWDKISHLAALVFGSPDAKNVQRAVAVAIEIDDMCRKQEQLEDEEEAHRKGG